MQCPNPIYIRNQHYNGFNERYYAVPCGQCPACITNRRGQWNFRLNQEVKNCVNAYFLTLTYAEDYLPRNSLGYPTFKKEDVQKFFKRLRKACEPLKIRYFLVGEYGGRRGRPHYHAILFDLPDFGDAWRKIFKIWSKGRISLSSCTPARIGYIANYMYGYYDGHNPEISDETNKVFMLCSRRPAIGASYLTPEMVKYHKDGYINHVQHGKITISLPRYYRDKIFTNEEKIVSSIRTRLYVKDKQCKQDEKDRVTDEKLIAKGLPSLSYFRIVNFNRRFYARKKKHDAQPVNKLE